MVYNWKVERLFPVDAQVAGDYLSDLQKQKGVLTPSIIVDESVDKSATLHNCFEWDDSRAAVKHRETQAKTLLGNLVVVKQIENKSQVKDVNIRAFVNIQNKQRTSVNAKKSCYIGIDEALSKEEYRKQVLDDALAELKSFQKKYSDLTELAAVFEAIEKIVI